MILMVTLWLQKVIKSKKNCWNKRKTTTTYSYKRKSISVNFQRKVPSMSNSSIVR